MKCGWPWGFSQNVDHAALRLIQREGTQSLGGALVSLLCTGYCEILRSVLHNVQTLVTSEQLLGPVYILAGPHQVSSLVLWPVA